MRFALTARTLAAMRARGEGLNEVTALNVRKVIRFRPEGEKELEAEVRRIEKEKESEDKEA